MNLLKRGTDRALSRMKTHADTGEQKPSMSSDINICSVYCNITFPAEQGSILLTKEISSCPLLKGQTITSTDLEKDLALDHYEGPFIFTGTLSKLKQDRTHMIFRFYKSGKEYALP